LTLPDRPRLDEALVARGLAPSRARARDAVLRGRVTVAGVVVTKPAHRVDATTQLAVAAEAVRWVSRGSEKLIAGLDAFGFDPAGRIAVDIGASTGGFTQVLLDRGASRVHAVDVGRDQLHATLRSDPRVVAHEATDARAIDANCIPDPIDAIVADVSFIALSKALGPALALARPGAWLIALIKPQFEVGPERVGKGGIVRDAAARADAVEGVRRWLETGVGWQLAGTSPSPITGSDGNAETLIGATRMPAAAA
jgi:23S rRNA (cytidine1920-2'-O)/16S rRNA (cytidine1409-2'-O)-methyltransferase